MTTAAIYARVSSARQKEEQTIASQTAALRETAERLGLEVPSDWVFEDEGYSGATLIRPALERLRDLAAQVPIDVVLCYSPDRLARRYAYQALLIDEFARAGTEVRFVIGPKGETPEDELLIQFQGMIAEYERAQIVERTRRGKAHRARTGTVNVLSGAPFGYRYLRRCDTADARYEIVEEQAAVVREMFRRYTEEWSSIADLARWLSAEGIATVKGKDRWDRSTVWGMLRNPAYAGRAGFLKTMRVEQRARVNRTARLQGQSVSRHAMTRPRAHEDWITIAVPAIVSEDTFALAVRRLEDNRRFASRNTKVPSLLMGLVACQSCGYAYYRTSTRTKKRKLYYYRCLGSDDYRYEHGRICDNKPVRADYLDDLVWGQVTALLADPRLVQAELDRRLEELRTANPATAERSRLELDLTRATKGIERLVQAYQEDLLTLDELRARMPELRAKETGLTGALASLDAQLLDRETYLTLTENLEAFLSRLRDTSEAATIEDRQKVLRSVVKEVLVGPERVVIRHSIPAHRPFRHRGYPLRLRSRLPTAQQHRPVGSRRSLRRGLASGDGRLQFPQETATPRVAQLSPGAICRRLCRLGRRHRGRHRRTARGSGSGTRPDGPAPVGGEDEDRPHRQGLRLSRVPHPAAPKARHGEALRVHLPFQGRIGLREGQGEAGDARGHGPAARHPHPPAQPGAARVDQLLPPRGLQGHLQLPAGLSLAPGHLLAASQGTPGIMEADPPTPSQRVVAGGWRGGAIQSRSSGGHPLPLSGGPHPFTVGSQHDGGSCIDRRHGLVESRMRGNTHVRFGGAGRGDDRPRGWHRTPVRLLRVQPPPLGEGHLGSESKTPVLHHRFSWKRLSMSAAVG
jgi:site-specific DNA recombinase